ncbi:MAG: DUF434 domain-containing protein [Syntrophobacteraceae bacterium]
MSTPPALPPIRKWNLFHAAADFFFFLNRSYPRAAALELVGNRYNLPQIERNLLDRGVFGHREALSRRGKREMGSRWREELLVVDGHNVQITIESHIEGRLLLKANDGAMRDLAGQSAKFRLSETSALAIDMIFRFLSEFPPREVLFLFDAPMSRSGETASMYRERIREARLSGDARAVDVPEREFPVARCVAASSDRAVLDASPRWIDLACRVIEHLGSPEITADFSQLIYSRSAERHLFSDGGPFW